MDRIYVTVRARPLSPEDEKSCPWRICANSISYNNQPSKFEFDRIFGEECKTREIYESRTGEIVAAAVRGFNGTVFAYGQTSSGKTHTMRGSPDEPGVIPLAVRELFNIIQEDTNREFLLRMSYMEIYNEEINDLLAPEHRRLQIHESIERGIFVAGLREEIVASPDQVLDLMEFGETHRHIGETNMNLHSSRSHTIFRMIIESRDRLEEGELESSCDAVRVSVLNLVDLAGSERAAKTGAEGVRLKEGSHINKSLLTLGTVIKKLSEGAENQGGHVPYRDSKLTRILQPALGGNANTAIICNITLAQVHADETKSTLQFASRALRVTNCAHVNEVLTDAALLKRQKKEIEELRAKLHTSHSEHFEEEILNLRNTLLKTELERERIALELEEEKRCQAEREKRLEEQELKIKNLSSMVLISNRDENREHRKRDKRRDTWCPGKLDRETSTNEDYKKLEVLAFEMEATIASLEEELALVKLEKEETVARNESLSSELELLSEKWNTLKSDSALPNEEIIELRSELEKSEAAHQKLDDQVQLLHKEKEELHKEKEELAVQLTDALLELEEERAIWYSKEKASVEAVKEKANAHDVEIMSLSTEISKVKSEILSLKEEDTAVRQRLKCAEEEAELERKCSMDMSVEIDRLKIDLEKWRLEKERSDQVSSLLQESRKERTKLRMRLRYTQSSLDGFRERYREALEQQERMHAKFKEAASGLKDRLAAMAIENLKLKKQLASHVA